MRYATGFTKNDADPAPQHSDEKDVEAIPLRCSHYSIGKSNIKFDFDISIVPNSSLSSN
jgi:hypothetical protein